MLNKGYNKQTSKCCRPSACLTKKVYIISSNYATCFDIVLNVYLIQFIDMHIQNYNTELNLKGIALRNLNILYKDILIYINFSFRRLKQKISFWEKVWVGGYIFPESILLGQYILPTCERRKMDMWTHPVIEELRKKNSRYMIYALRIEGERYPIIMSLN